jgi:hypothetical protein
MDYGQAADSNTYALKKLWIEAYRIWKSRETEKTHGGRKYHRGRAPHPSLWTAADLLGSEA